MQLIQVEKPISDILFELEELSISDLSFIMEYIVNLLNQKKELEGVNGVSSLDGGKYNEPVGTPTSPMSTYVVPPPDVKGGDKK